MVTSVKSSMVAQNMPRPFVPKSASTPSIKDLKKKVRDLSSLLEAAENEHENTLPLLIEHQAHME